MSPSTPYFLARSRLANLSKTLPPSDPRLSALRAEMAESFVVHKVAQALADGPAMTPALRERIENLLAMRDVRAVA